MSAQEEKQPSLSVEEERARDEQEEAEAVKFGHLGDSALGRALGPGGGATQLNRAIEYYKNAIKLDPSSTLNFDGLTIAQDLLVNHISFYLLHCIQHVKLLLKVEQYLILQHLLHQKDDLD